MLQCKLAGNAMPEMTGNETTGLSPMWQGGSEPACLPNSHTLGPTWHSSPRHVPYAAEMGMAMGT